MRSKNLVKKQSLWCLMYFLIISCCVVLLSFRTLALPQKDRSIELPDELKSLSRTSSVPNETRRQKAVEKDGLQFETIIPESVIKIPENKPNARSLIRFGCRITNKTQSPIRVSGWEALTPRTISSGKNSIGWGGSSESRFPFYTQPYDYPFERISSKSTYPLLMPEESATFFLNGYLFWDENDLTIELDDPNSFKLVWTSFRFDQQPKLISLESRDYYFWFEYENQEKKVRNRIVQAYEGQLPKEDLWRGTVRTPVVKFRLVNAK